MPEKPCNKDTEELLKKGLNELGFTYSESQISSFITFLHELKKWNRAYNLTALKTDRDIIIKHFLDSLLYLEVITIEFGARSSEFGVKVADVGTGAGFPGIPMKIMEPELDMTLIESSMKKASFLRHIVRTLKLSGINILNSRIETLGENHKKACDVIVSRATFKIKDFIDKACPYVAEDGILVLSKGPKVIEELRTMKGTCGEGVVEKTFKFSLENNERNLLVIKCI